MKKILFLLMFLVILTGCTVKSINDEDIVSIFDSDIVEKNYVYLELFNGFDFAII